MEPDGFITVVVMMMMIMIAGAVVATMRHGDPRETVHGGSRDVTRR